MTPFLEMALLTGVGATASVGMIAAVAATPEASIAPYVGGGAGVIAVGALAEVVRRLLNGSLIPRAVKDYEDELGASIRASAERESESMRDREESRRQTALALKATEDVAHSLDEFRREFNLLRRSMEGMQ